MIGIVPRYSPDQLNDYFRDDFASRMWQVDSPTSQLARLMTPKVGVLNQNSTSKTSWEPFTYEQFLLRIDKLKTEFGRNSHNKKRVCSLELVFSPPKSFSIAALAGKTSEEGKLCRFHGLAVDAVLEFATKFLFTRKTQSKVTTLDPIEVEAIRFPHPINDLGEPQLHEHVNLLWYADEKNKKKGALYTYPLFFYQRTMRALYDFALCYYAKNAELAVRVDGDRWNLDGIDDDVIQKFSQRSLDVGAKAMEKEWNYWSPGAAKRFAAFSTRTLGCKVDGAKTLSERRILWAQTVPQEKCRVNFVSPEPQENLIFPAGPDVFLRSAVTTRPLLAGRILELCKGQMVPPVEALRQIDARIDQLIKGGEVLGGPDKRAFCHRDLFETEQIILNFVRDGLDKGKPGRIKSPAVKVSRHFLAALARADRVRIVSLEGRGLPDLALSPLMAGDSAPILLTLDQWNPLKVKSLLEKNQKVDVIIAINESPRAGDFLGVVGQIVSAPEKKLTNRRRFYISKHSFDVERGKIPEAVGDAIGVEGLNGPGISAVIVRPNYPEISRKEWNWELGKRWILHRPMELSGEIVVLDTIIPWENVQDPGFVWPGKTLYAHRNNPVCRVGSRWTVIESRPEILRVRGIRRTIDVSLSALLAEQDHVAIVEPRLCRAPKGLQLEVLLNFQSRGETGTTLYPGEIVVCQEVLADESIRLVDGRIIPLRFRALAPAMLVRHLVRHQQPVERLLVEVSSKQDIRKVLQQVQERKVRIDRITLLSDKDDALRDRIQAEIDKADGVARPVKITRLCDGGPEVSALMLPSRSFWAGVVMQVLAPELVGTIRPSSPKKKVENVEPSVPKRVMPIDSDPHFPPKSPEAPPKKVKKVPKPTEKLSAPADSQKIS